MNEAEPLLTVRPWDPAKDIPFVMSTWIRSYVGLCKIERRIYLDHHRAMVTQLLERPGVMVMVACSPSLPATIHAWVAGERPNVVHYAYAPPELRGKGIVRRVMTELLGGYPERVAVTHRFAQHHPPLSRRFEYNPYKLRWAA